MGLILNQSGSSEATASPSTATPSVHSENAPSSGEHSSAPPTLYPLPFTPRVKLFGPKPEDFVWASGIENTFVVQARKGHRSLDEYELMGHYDHWKDDLRLAK